MTHPAKLQPRQAAPDFSLPATDGSTLSLLATCREHDATVVTFICNHCPYVQAYIPRLIALQKKYAGRLRIIGICSNDATTYPDDDFPSMQTAVADWGLNFPYLHDADQSVARAYGAERTPEIFLLDKQGTCRYEGGIDDNYQNESAVTDRPLADAIDALLAGRPVKRPTTYAIGCTIKWKP